MKKTILILSVAFLGGISLNSCGGNSTNEENSKENSEDTLKVESSDEVNLVNKIFVSIESYGEVSSLFYFYSQDSVFHRYRGSIGDKYGYNLNNKGILSITKNGETRKDTYTDLSYEHNYQLIGDKVLSGEFNTFYSVNSFSEAFQISEK